MDRVNQAVWARDAGRFAIEGWSDPGELQALVFAADVVRGGPILDIGVGAGRTVALLRLISSDYAAVDYTPEMVALCRARHPGVDVRLGDARDLRDHPDGSRQLVVFSINGIDAVDHQDRQKVLASVARVLRPGGLFVFSTLNKHGPLFGAHPGSAPELAWEPGSLLPRAAPAPDGTGGDGGAGDRTGGDGTDGGTDGDGTDGDGTDGDGTGWAAAVVNWRRLQKQATEAEDWGIAPFAAHSFGLLTHFITPDGARRELDRHGMDTLAVFTCDGERVDDRPTDALYVHLIARRR